MTLTLPDDIIATLRSIDRDLSRAVVRVIEPMAQTAPAAPAELTNYGDRAIIIVPNNRALKQRTGVELVPLSDGRALISFDDRLSIAQIELKIGDALADSDVVGDDRAIFEALVEILRNARRANGVMVRQRSIIVLQRTEPSTNDQSSAPQPLSA